MPYRTLRCYLRSTGVRPYRFGFSGAISVVGFDQRTVGEAVVVVHDAFG